MPASELRPLGGTGLTVTALCAGGGPIGGMPENFGYDTPERRGIETAARVLASPIRFLDTSNNYGGGRSERRIGTAIAEAGGLPPDFVLATKVDRDDDGDFSAARVRRSLEESLTRLGLDRVQLLYLHDPEHVPFEDAMGPGGAVGELLRIRDEGLADHLGVAGGPVDLMRRYVETGAFEVLLTHNRYTLVDRSADRLIDAAADRGLAVVNGAVYGGGILARGVRATSKYAYRTAAPEILAAVEGIEAACARHGVPLAAAAVQFSTRDPRITSTVLGFSHPERVDEALAQAAWDIPDDLWPEIDALLPAAEHWLH